MSQVVDHFFFTLQTNPSINSPQKAEEQLKTKNIYLSDWGKDILEKTQFSQEAKQYDLVRLSVAQLGFTITATIQEIYNKAQQLGLELCPAEVGPQLRLQYNGKYLIGTAISLSLTWTFVLAGWSSAAMVRVRAAGGVVTVCLFL